MATIIENGGGGGNSGAGIIAGVLIVLLVVIGFFFFINNNGGSGTVDVDVPKEKTTQSYVPYEVIPQIKSQLKTGDIVNFVKGTSDSSAWVHHMGFVRVMPDGEVHLIHSTKPRVREETIETFIANNTKNNEKNDAMGRARHRGFKFFRLSDDPMANLRHLDGDQTPKVTVPADSPVSFDAYAERERNRRR